MLTPRLSHESTGCRFPLGPSEVASTPSVPSDLGEELPNCGPKPPYCTYSTLRYEEPLGPGTRGGGRRGRAFLLRLLRTPSQPHALGSLDQSTLDVVSPYSVERKHLCAWVTLLALPIDKRRNRCLLALGRRGFQDE